MKIADGQHCVLESFVSPSIRWMVVSSISSMFLSCRIVHPVVQPSAPEQKLPICANCNFTPPPCLLLEGWSCDIFFNVLVYN